MIWQSTDVEYDSDTTFNAIHELPDPTAQTAAKYIGI